MHMEALRFQVQGSYLLPYAEKQRASLSQMEIANKENNNNNARDITITASLHDDAVKNLPFFTPSHLHSPWNIRVSQFASLKDDYVSAFGLSLPSAVGSKAKDVVASLTKNKRRKS